MANSKSTEKGFENLLEVHTHALEQNSEKVVEILERLSKVKLDPKSQKIIKRIKSELKSIDNKLDTLDRAKVEDIPSSRINKNKKEEDLFEF